MTAQISFPIYMLHLSQQWRIVFPDSKRDIGHVDFWEHTVSHLVAAHYKIPQAKLASLPYCQRRARIVGNTIYSGQKPDRKLLLAIRKATENGKLRFAYDEHEKRLRADVLEFRKLVRHYRPESSAR